MDVMYRLIQRSSFFLVEVPVSTLQNFLLLQMFLEVHVSGISANTPRLLQTSRKSPTCPWPLTKMKRRRGLCRRFSGNYRVWWVNRLEVLRYTKLPRLPKVKNKAFGLSCHEKSFNQRACSLVAFILVVFSCSFIPTPCGKDVNPN